MSVVIVGHRRYGRVRAHGGEYAETVFAHLSYLPLWPMGSVWVTSEPGGGEAAAFPIRIHARSVAAAYLRTWLPVIAAFCAIVPTPVATGVAVGLAAVSAWSWTWRSRRGTRTLQRSDFDRVALGTRCDPAWMTRATRDERSRALTARLAARVDARPPDDVARFGPRDLDEATAAYGVLRIAGVDRREARAAADKLLANTMSPPPGGPPYRDSSSGPPGSLGAQISALAHAHAAAARIRPAGYSWYGDRKTQLFFLCLASALAAFLIYREVPAGDITARQLDREEFPYERRVTVRCDKLEDPHWDVLEDDSPVQRVTFCWLGKRALPVVSDADAPADGRDGLVVEGRIQLPGDHPTQRERVWLAMLPRDARLDTAFSVYVQREPETTRRAFLLALVACTAGAVVGWPLWLAAVLRRKR